MDGAHAWFKSYLSDRRQCVKYDGSLSSWGSIGVGVLQGSILGPLLFSLFVNDLPNVVDHTCVNMYADDTELHCSEDDLQSVQYDLQSDNNQIQTWLHANRLQLNVSKSVIMMLGSWQKLLDSFTSMVKLLLRSLPLVI